jgi:hypothetical protein
LSGGFSYSADLATTGLPEVFGIIQRYAVPGMLEVTRAGMVKRVFTQDGYVVHASSSDPIDRLSEHIRRTGLVEAESIDALDHERSNSSERLGVLLIERGLLSPRAVYEAVCGQIERIVWSLFAWRSGRAVFVAGEMRGDDVVHIKLPMRRVAFEGVKRAPDVESDLDGASILEPTYRYEDLIDIGVDALEMDLLRRVDGDRTVEEIVAGSPLSEAETVRRLRAFEVLAVVRIRSEVGSASGDLSIHS